jgi:hypothetical protein
MVKFKTPEEIEARRVFIAGADKDGIIQQQESIWSFSDLKKLSNDELINRMEQVDNQAILMRWRILWVLRQRFPSDRLFGQYIAELKATRANCAGSHQEINRALHAGRFCARHRITDLNSVGLLQSSIYVLSRPANEYVADEVYKKIKNKNVQVKDVERYVEQAKAVLTIEQQPQQPVEMDYERDSTELHFIQDTNNIAIKPDFIESIASLVERIDLQPEITKVDSYAHAPESNHQRRMAILATLPPLDDEISNDEIIAEVRLLCSQFMSPVFKIIPLIKLFMNQLSAEKHGK